MKETKLIWDKWWDSKSAVDRYLLMEKHNVTRINNKFIRRMYNKENSNNCLCCAGTGYIEGDSVDDLQSCLTCNGSGKLN